MSKSFQALKAKLLRDPAVRREYDRLGPEFELAREMIRARERAGLTQAQVAKRMGTTQSAVARIEGGKLPSIRTLTRYAAAMGARPVVKFVAKK